MSFATLGVTALALLTVIASLVLGNRGIPLGEVVAALFTDVDSDDATVITSQRLPRTMLGVAVGLALGMAGALMQGHTRNPLADPGLFGVNAGASFAVALLVFALGVTEPTAIVAASLIGAGAVSGLVFLIGLGSMRGGALVMLAILGTTMAALLTSLTTALILLDKNTLNVLRFWEVGALSNRDFALLPYVLPIMAIGSALALANGFSLNVLGLGEDIAKSLGTDVRRARIVGIVAVTLLCGPATAICGPLVFIGLVAPHVARVVSGHDYRWLVPLSGLVGVAVLLTADTVGRVSARPGELQAGIVAAVLGAPLLLAIARRRRLVSL
jgi:iron complex transport system permease protein